MKKLYRPFIKGANWALAGLLAVLGFGACKDYTVEYGTPFADYTVKGTVVNKVTGKPVEGIRVGYREPVNALMYGPPMTSYGEKSIAMTDAGGAFQITEGMFPGEVNPVPVYVTDVDGEANGSFAQDTLMVNFEGAKRSGKETDWYQGEYTVTIKVELTEQKADE
ncbi:MAG: radical SAM-associated putative lipoprotein [Tannerella sp.]|jgi:putative lipoprotein (rSAM/lipoprotein system)|nr:radical SAM-associated putative lipoprotein [Tannerella sp.]